MPVVSLCGTPYSADRDITGELIVKRPLLCSDVFPLTKSFGRVFPNIEFSHLSWGLNSSVIVWKCVKLGWSYILCLLPIVGLNGV